MRTSTTGSVAVIGAGFSGLGAAAALKRRGIPFDVYEAEDDVGGNWLNGVYETVHLISSRKTTAYAEYPMPETYPDFPGARQMLEYLRSYAEHFDLRPHIRFRTRVVGVEPREDGAWTVRLATGEVLVHRAVVVCIGHDWDARYPEYPGRFDGEILHAKQYKEPSVLRGKRVLVVGGGNSACDIAVEAGRFADAAHLSVRRGYWFLPRTIMGIPLPELSSPWMPVWLQRLTLQAALKVIVGDYRRYGLPRPDHRLFERHPTINSDLLQALKLGRITPHPDIRRLDGSHVEFTNGTREAFDLIIYATGYHLSFPLLQDGILTWRNGVPQLLGGFIHPNLKNLYFLELHFVRYGLGPLISAQADAIAALIDVQDRLEAPAGMLLQRLGVRPVRTLMSGPFEVIRFARRIARFAGWLPRIESVLPRTVPLPATAAS